MRQGRNLFGGVGSNPTLVTLFCGSLPRARTKQQATGRIELPTLGLQDQCSATELSRRRGKDKATERIELSTPGLRDLCSATELSGLCDRMAEWSKAPDSSSGLFGGAGSNPARCNTRIAQSAERRPFKPVVEGSSPSSGVAGVLFFIWGCSSFGRAPASHAGGRGIDALHVHKVAWSSGYDVSFTPKRSPVQSRP